MNSPQNFFTQNPVKKFCVLPVTGASGRGSDALAAKVLKQVMVNTGGNKRQVPAKRQNRGSRNSTDDGAENQREEKAG
ncbi:single-stranded DNA-binding protein [Escherichia coli]|uniref:single-stranded DNA-binding protein n=1 Tax=Escherichia coli TaxID=562 RepID=UPI001484FB31|nr:single-stranded DNA-binding protein [Escherichia coli]QJS66432.1 single-stranded DNA-binding protein [Escherichia coli]